MKCLTRRDFAKVALAGGAAILGGLPGCATTAASVRPDSAPSDGAFDASEGGSAAAREPSGIHPREVEGFGFTEGSLVDRGFVAGNTLEAQQRALHFSLHVPRAYDGSVPFALYVACPGWEGLYFQGVGADLQEDYPFIANDYVPDMIVCSVQLDDWGDRSAADTIMLTEWLLDAFNVDPERVYLSGCSGGGETVSIVLGTRPELYRRALHVISRWDGDVETLADAETPVRLAIGERNDYYGSGPAREAAESIRRAYRERGLSDARIGELVVIDVKPTSYFVERGFSEDDGQHGAGGYLFAHDEQIMGWLFS